MKLYIFLAITLLTNSFALAAKYYQPIDIDETFCSESNSNDKFHFKANSRSATIGNEYSYKVFRYEEVEEGVLRILEKNAGETLKSGVIYILLFSKDSSFQMSVFYGASGAKYLDAAIGGSIQLRSTKYCK